ncbi:MAG: trimethylamine methyltransferase family protein, partial [Verrucomicrobiae bacterium]|nr:trimethylamine methyltransferase family protein [Verrucomicrobiae bacterium]
AMLDLDLNRAMHMFARGVSVTEETLAVDLINAMEFAEGTSYLDTEHTAEHFREVLWDAKYFDRAYRSAPTLRPGEEDEKLLRKADAAWREIVAAQRDPELPEDFLREVDRIAEAARKELLA